MRPWRAGIAGAAAPVAVLGAAMAALPSDPAPRAAAPLVRPATVPNYMPNRCLERPCTARLVLSARRLDWASPEVFAPDAAFALDLRVDRHRLTLRRAGSCVYRGGGLVLTACVDANDRIRLRLRVPSRSGRHARLSVGYRQLRAPAPPALRGAPAA